MAHSGRGFWYDRAFFLSKIHKNVYMELSGLPPQNVLNYFPDFEKNNKKVIFGSDWPVIKSIKENIHVLESLPLKKTTLEQIFLKNAKKILNI
jgi:predicted TIM-barrel fold metal-dependent hydrolase